MLTLPVDPAIKPLVIIFTFLLGLSIGSFLNVVALRFLNDEEFVNKPSHCPKCSKEILPIDNIPVASYIILGGACRNCKEPISIQYPLVELATGLLFVFVVWNYGVSLQSLLLLFLMANLVVIFVTDWRESLIFEINSKSLIPAGIIYNLLNLGNVPGHTTVDLGMVTFPLSDAVISSVLAIALAFVFFEGMILLSRIMFETDGFGHGDTHLMMGVGAFVGWQVTVMALVLGFVLQLIPAVPILVYQWIKEKRWTSLISGTVAVVSGVFPLVTTFYPQMVGNDQRVVKFLHIGCVVVSLVALFFFLKNVKSSQNFTYLPLGPALVIGSIVGVFWGRHLIGLLLFAIS